MASTNVISMKMQGQRLLGVVEMLVKAAQFIFYIDLPLAATAVMRWSLILKSHGETDNLISASSDFFYFSF